MSDQPTNDQQPTTNNQRPAVQYLTTLAPKLTAVLRQHAPVVAAYLILTLFFTYPLPLHLTDAIAGEHVADTLQNYWNLWWTGHALLTLHENPFYATFIQYPFGLPLFFHTYNFLNGFLSVPLQLCCGTPAAYNLMFVFSFVMSGIGAYILVFYLSQGWELPASNPAPVSNPTADDNPPPALNRRATDLRFRQGPAFIAGLIYAFSPYMAFHLKAGQPFMTSLEWFPLYLWLLLRGLREHGRWLPLAALFLVMIGLTDWHYTVYALLLTGIVWLYEALQVRRWRDLSRLVGKGAVVGILFALGMAPILIPMFRELGQQEYATRDLRHSIFHSTDLMAFFLPSIFHPLWGEWANEIFSARLVEPFIAGGVASLGVVPLVLALCGVLGDRRRSRLFVLLVLIFFVLALGPYLRVNGWKSIETAHPIPLPYLLFRQLPFMDIHRIPSRFVSVVMLSLAVLAAMGITWLWQRPAVARLSRRRQSMLLLLLALLVLFEYWPYPFKMTPVDASQVPPFYRQISHDPEAYAILEVPDLDFRSMFYQTYHGKPIMGGQIARPRGHPWRRARFFGALLRVVPAWEDVGKDDSASAVRSALRCQGIRYVVFYQHAVGEATRGRIDRLERGLFADSTPVYSDASMHVYEVQQEHRDEPYWTLDPRQWNAVEAMGTAGVRGRWAVGETGSVLISACGQTHALLDFDIFGYGENRTIEITQNEQIIGRFALPLGWVRRVTLPLALQPGENRVELRSIEPATPAPIAARDESTDAPAETRKLSFNLSQVSVVSY